MTLLDELEEPAGWERFVEDWWIEQCFAMRVLVEDGLRRDFLMETVWEPPRLTRDDHHGLFAKFGILHHYYHHWQEDFEAGQCVANMHILSDPEWGGLTRWREMEKLPPPDDGIPYSPTMVYKASVLATNMHAAGVDLDSRRPGGQRRPTVDTIVNWGGGIGLQSLIMRQWGSDHTEYLIDLPVMSVIQHEFLSHNLDADQVHLADRDVKDGVINIVPLTRLDLVPQGCDVFLSLHGLSESTVAAQQYVQDRDWFDAERLVLEWTEGIFFSGTEHWAEVAAELEAAGRILPRDEVRSKTFRSRWNGDTELLAGLYEEKYGAPALRVTSESWKNMPLPHDWTTRDIDVLMELARLPIIVLDVTQLDRGQFDLVKMHAGAPYRLEEHREALVFLDKDLFPDEGADDAD